jgi:hypothetical protein
MTQKERYEYLSKLEILETDEDIQASHEEADKILCDILNKMGFEDIVEAWERIDKYYA